jgi:hypothetical protein
MATTQPPVELERVACEICLREVPRSEAIVPEAADYVVYFCGLECFETWKNSPPASDDTQASPGGTA